MNSYMKAQLKFYITEMLILIFSPFWGYFSINMVFANSNLTTEYATILEGFITAFRWSGILIFGIGNPYFIMTEIRSYQ